MKRFEINEITYTFFNARFDGVDVIACSWDNGTESSSEWSAEALGLPVDEEEATDYLTAYSWQTVSSGDDFVEIDRKAELSQAASAMGKLGGAAKTEAKSAASRENGKKGGRPKKAIVQAEKEEG